MSTRYSLEAPSLIPTALPTLGFQGEIRIYCYFLDGALSGDINMYIYEETMCEQTKNVPAYDKSYSKTCAISEDSG